MKRFKHDQRDVALTGAAEEALNGYLDHVLGYNTSGISTLFFRFGRTHLTPG